MSNWTGVTRAYERSFATLCAGTIEPILIDTAGDRVLDVGCGTGELAARAGRAARTVTAVDADPDMATTARKRVRDVVVAALPVLPFVSHSFDTVVANFVVNHVPDPSAAVIELARLVGRHGRVAMTIWPAGGAGWAPVVGEVLTTAGAVPLPNQRLAPELDFERTPEGLAELAATAGLQPRIVKELEWEWVIAADDLWAGIAGGVATPGQTYLTQTKQVRTAIADGFTRRAAALADGNGLLRFANRAAYVLAEA